MLKAVILYVALASAAAAPTRQPPKGPEFDRGGPDSLMVHELQAKQDEARRYVDDFARCIASHNRKQSAAFLALRYGSSEQGNVVSKLAGSVDSCWGPMITSMKIGFESQALAAGLAEYFVLHPQVIDDLRRRAPESFVWPAQSALEQFGSCVVAQNEGQIRGLIATPVASSQEMAAAQGLAPLVAPCVPEGQTLELNPGSLRELLAVSLYRRIAAPPPAAATP